MPVASPSFRRVGRGPAAQPAALEHARRRVRVPRNSRAIAMPAAPAPTTHRSAFESPPRPRACLRSSIIARLPDSHAMRSGRLPGTDLTPSRLGFGSALADGHGSGGGSPSALLEVAHDSGITHFDTARAYGYGEAESAVGRLPRRAPRQRDRDHQGWDRAAAPLARLRARPRRSPAWRVSRAPAAVPHAALGARRPCRRRPLRARRGARQPRDEPARAADRLGGRPAAARVPARRPRRPRACSTSSRRSRWTRKGPASFGLGTDVSVDCGNRRRAPAVRPGGADPQQRRRRARSSAHRCSPVRAVITHSAVRPGDRPARRADARTNRRRTQWSDALGARLRGPEVLGRLLLAHALASNPAGVVLFASTSEARIRPTPRSQTAGARPTSCAVRTGAGSSCGQAIAGGSGHLYRPCSASPWSTTTCSCFAAPSALSRRSPTSGPRPRSSRSSTTRPARRAASRAEKSARRRLERLGVRQSNFRRLLPLYPTAVRRLPSTASTASCRAAARSPTGARPPEAAGTCATATRRSATPGTSGRGRWPRSPGPCARCCGSRCAATARSTVGPRGRVDQYVANWRLTRERIRASGAATPPIVHPPVDVTASRVGEPGDYVLFVGELVRHKRPSWRSRRPSRRAGRSSSSAPARSWAATSARYGERAQFLGRVADDELARLYSRAPQRSWCPTSRSSESRRWRRRPPGGRWSASTPAACARRWCRARPGCSCHPTTWARWPRHCGRLHRLRPGGHPRTRRGLRAPGLPGEDARAGGVHLRAIRRSASGPPLPAEIDGDPPWPPPAPALGVRPHRVEPAGQLHPLAHDHVEGGRPGSRSRRLGTSHRLTSRHRTRA